MICYRGRLVIGMNRLFLLVSQYFSIRDYPVSLNKSSKYKLLKKHETETGTTLCLQEQSGDGSDAVDVSLTDWQEKLQDSECREYTGGDYCSVLL